MKKFDWNDMLLTASKTSSISSRKVLNIHSEGKLPLFVAPMDTVIDIDNIKTFEKEGFNICLTRDIKCGTTPIPGVFYGYGLDEFISKTIDNNFKEDLILIDIANGNMIKLIDAIKSFKNKFPNKQLMVGNVANPETYTELSNAGADLIRVGVGNGQGCLTTFHTGIGYPMGSLIQETYLESLKLDNPAKIIADGGFKEYSDIIKALAIGADYVMLGSLLNKSIESAGQCYWKGIKISDKIGKYLYDKGFNITKKFRGMSTKEVQIKMGKKVLTSSEGVVTSRKVEYTLNGWTENFKDYLKSAMSYSDKSDINKFIGGVDYNLISDNSFKRYNK